MPLYRNQEPLAEPMPPDAIERAASDLAIHLVNRARLKEQLLEEVEAAKLKEKEGPQRVPSPLDYTSREHTEPHKLAKVHAVMNFRAPVEFIDDDTEKPEQVFFGIPRVKHTSKTITRPYQGRRSIGVISTR
jgi:hypothetical protein